ncbi:hypothetical protein N8447_00460 [bacterium]|nr:hypothetical protein [bacterium]
MLKIWQTNMACNCSNINSEFWRAKTPTSKKVDDAPVTGTGAGKTVIELYNELYNRGSWSTDKSKACSLKDILKKLEKKGWVKADATELDRAQKLKNKICKNIIGVEEEEVVVTNNGGEEVAAQPEKIVYGCLDDSATNYYCKENDCVDNKPPEGIVDVTCEYERELEVDNIYLFCDSQECTQDTPGERVTPNNDIASWMNNGALDNDHIFKVKAGIKKVIEDIDETGIFLKSKKGFYTRQLPQQLINEFANALTVMVFNTKFNEDNSYKTFPYTKVTVYTRNSQPLGQFKIESNKDRNGESDSIRKITMHDSPTTLNNRLRDEVGTELLDLTHEPKLLKHLKHPYFKDVRFTVKDGKIVTKDIQEGLGVVLKEEPIGLAKLLK